MKRYSLIVVTDETSPVRRFDVRRQVVQRALWGAGIAVAVLLAVLGDYVRLRIERPELATLRVETSEQRAKIEAFDTRVSNLQRALDRVAELERKVRIIANLPGSAATGGDSVVEVGGAGGDLEAAERGEPGVAPAGEGGPDSEEPLLGEAPAAALEAAPGADRASLLTSEVERLGLVADARKLSLLELVQKLEDKHRHLASSPAIWPTKGWLTSRFGSRTSPFTGRRQFHSGIDIAGRRGTDVVASARGVVKFTGRRGPLGNTVIIDHGYGVQSHYGHTDEIFVKRGQAVERGQVIASLGNTGRSTGPHLHYGVEVAGKTVNPLNYIFD
ncbi:MAG: M23 family metallopeptidase [Myxococcales bacterium]|nr:M23 family metallopeptidase [Myxococcales bacterium]